MEHGVGAAAHGDVESHGIEESLTCGYRAWEHAFIAVLIVGQGILHNLTGSLTEQLYAVGMRGQDGAVARQCQSYGLRQRVHRVGCEHAAARAAAGTGTGLYLLQFFVAHRRVGTLHHSRDEVGILATPASSLHRTATAEDGGDIESHGCHEHAWGHLVAVGDADHGISLVCVDHILY